MPHNPHSLYYNEETKALEPFDKYGLSYHAYAYLREKAPEELIQIIARHRKVNKHLKARIQRLQKRLPD